MSDSEVLVVFVRVDGEDPVRNISEWRKIRVIKNWKIGKIN